MMAIDDEFDYSPEQLEAQILSLEEQRARRRGELAEGSQVIDLRRLSDYSDEVVQQSKLPTIDFGLESLNRLAPLPIRSMATLLGPTGAGKTALAMTLAAHRTRYSGTPAANQGPALYMLFELTPPQLTARRAAQLSPYTWGQVLGGALSAVEIRDVIGGENLFVVKPPRDVDAIGYAKAALDKLRELSPGVPLLVVDYLQRIRGKGHDTRERLSNVVDELVDLTESRDMYTLLLSKGSRGGSRTMRDGKTRGEALVDAAAETSSIEAGSSIMLAITYENRDGGDTTDASLQIAKGRFGATGAQIGMRFHGASGRWEELEGVPLSKLERDCEDKIRDALRSCPDGYETRTALVKAAGLQKQAGLSTLKRLCVPGGWIETRDGRLYMKD